MIHTYTRGAFAGKWINLAVKGLAIQVKRSKRKKGGEEEDFDEDEEDEDDEACLTEKYTTVLSVCFENKGT